MSDLFQFRVLAVEGASARVHAFAGHPDEHYIPVARNFALQLIVDAYHNLRAGWVEAPDGSRDGSWLRDRPALRALVEPWRELAQGREVAITPAELAALESGRASRAGLASFGLRDGATYKTYATEHARFRELAERVVVAVQLENERNNPRPPDSENQHPEATLVFTLTEPTALAVLYPGLTWASAIYDFTGW